MNFPAIYHLDFFWKCNCNLLHDRNGHEMLIIFYIFVDIAEKLSTDVIQFQLQPYRENLCTNFLAKKRFKCIHFHWEKLI